MVNSDFVAIKVEAIDAVNAAYTVAAGTQISKGMLMTLSDPRTMVKAVEGVSNQPVGIANAEKDASDTSTELGVWTKGFFDIVASGAITKGDQVRFVDNGHVQSVFIPTGIVFTAGSLALIAGIAQETAADQERIEVKINIP